MGVNASNLVLLFRFKSWFPNITMVGSMLHNVDNRLDTTENNSGDMFVFECTISPPKNIIELGVILSSMILYNFSNTSMYSSCL